MVRPWKAHLLVLFPIVLYQSITISEILVTLIWPWVTLSTSEVTALLGHCLSSHFQDWHHWWVRRDLGNSNISQAEEKSLREHTKLDAKNENKLGGNGPDVYLQAKRPRVIPPDRSGVFPLRRLASWIFQILALRMLWGSETLKRLTTSVSSTACLPFFPSRLCIFLPSLKKQWQVNYTVGREVLTGRAP